MLKLNQEAFLKTILSDSMEKATWVSSDYPNERLAIYRNTVISHLVQALKLTYPGVWQLLGESCATQVAKLYLKDERHFPQSGCLDDWGAGYANFLKTVSHLSSLTYLSDYAQYEWIKHLSECAPDEPMLSINTIQTILQEMENPCFTFHSSVQLISSAYPLDRIDNLIGHPDSDNIILDDQGVYGIVVRINGDIVTFWLESSEWAFVNELYQDGSLARVYSTFNPHQEEGIDRILAQYLMFIFRNGLISNIIDKR